jgi:ribosomal protein L35
MPKVKTKSGKVKHYPYTGKGKAAAKKARRRKS